MTRSVHVNTSGFRSAGSHCSGCLPIRKSGVLSELSTVFGGFSKITIVGPTSIHRLAWNTTADGFSAVKAKLVDSLI